ncbi:CyoC Heme/copper-type cytochrome/quinol oxidase, subunit 3 [Candidatus Methylopumilus universalis]|uniref:cytochrome c oxidase subunit 3 n=1 Tax=Candidatus Methylopumilus universalis TaxID=2588536 RepID=UPI003BEF38E4
MASKDIYFVPELSKWPIVGSLALFTLFVGSAMLLNQSPNVKYVFIVGIAAVIYMFAGWFSNVIAESLAGKYNKQVDTSFRMGMGWFILSEVMFFAAFFGALFYARVLSVPWLSGEGHGVVTHQFLWPAFKASWPMAVMPNPTNFTAYKDTVPAFGVPAVNTLILLSSGVTVTFAHWALKKAQRTHLCVWLAATVALGALFVYLQAGEYHHAYTELSLKLSSGIYGSTFYLLTGFHGFHVTMGAVMLAVILLRSIKGHFTKNDHFAFEAVAWYWHFVDVVWLGLFIFVYWL